MKRNVLGFIIQLGQNSKKLGIDRKSEQYNQNISKCRNLQPDMSYALIEQKESVDGFSYLAKMEMFQPVGTTD